MNEDTQDMRATNELKEELQLRMKEVQEGRETIGRAGIIRARLEDKLADAEERAQILQESLTMTAADAARQLANAENDKRALRMSWRDAEERILESETVRQKYLTRLTDAERRTEAEAERLRCMTDGMMKLRAGLNDTEQRLKETQIAFDLACAGQAKAIGQAQDAERRAEEAEVEQQNLSGVLGVVEAKNAELRTAIQSYVMEHASNCCHDKNEQCASSENVERALKSDSAPERMAETPWWRRVLNQNTELRTALEFLKVRVVEAIWPEPAKRGATIKAGLEKAERALKPDGSGLNCPHFSDTKEGYSVDVGGYLIGLCGDCQRALETQVGNAQCDRKDHEPDGPKRIEVDK